MTARNTTMRVFEAAGLAAGLLLAGASMPSAAAEFSARQNVAAAASSTELYESARWTGRAATVTKISDQQDAGWWVVLASPPSDQDVQAIVREMEDCGLHPFNDFSGKFEGFRPGFNVVVDGAYATRSEAEAVRSAALVCAPDAYVKWARYLGE